jgi:hypothetical protein
MYRGYYGGYFAVELKARESLSDELQSELHRLEALQQDEENEDG